MHKDTITKIERCLKKDKLSEAIEILLDDLGPKYIMIRLSVMTLAGRLKREEKSFFQGLKTQEQYSIARTKISRSTLLLLRDLKKTNRRFLWLLGMGMITLVGITLLLIAIYVPSRGITISLPKVKGEKISFPIFVDSKLESPTRFLFEVPEDGASLMPGNYVKLYSGAKDSIPLTLIQNTTAPNFTDGTDLLNQLRSIKSNEVEVRELGKGFYRLEFFSKEAINATPEEIYHFLSLSCYHEDNIDIPCKTKMTSWNYLKVWQIRLALFLLVGISSCLFLLLLYPLLKSTLV